MSSGPDLPDAVSTPAPRPAAHEAVRPALRPALRPAAFFDLDKTVLAT